MVLFVFSSEYTVQYKKVTKNLNQHHITIFHLKIGKAMENSNELP